MTSREELLALAKEIILATGGDIKRADEAAHVIAGRLSASTSADREAIARVIAGDIFGTPDRLVGPATRDARQRALDKADTILALLPAQTVKVRELEWSSYGPHHHEAPGMGVTYQILRVDGTWLLFSGCKIPGDRFGTLDAAKAAAQADYEQRIRSALVTDEAAQAVHPDVSALRGALNGLIEAVRRDADEPGGRGISGYTSARLSDARASLAATSSREVSEEELHQRVFMSVHDAVESKVTPILLANEVWTGTLEAARAILSRYRVTKKDGV